MQPETILDDQATRLLAFLVSKLPKATPNRPEAFITYKGVHQELGLQMIGRDHGDSLEAQGMRALGEWTAAAGKPAITGLIINGTTFQPGKGYFVLFNRDKDDFRWWSDQIMRSKMFDWSPYLDTAPLPEPPVAADFDVPAGRSEFVAYRIIRDSALARRVKKLHGHQCQICGHAIALPNGELYSEAHHVQPLGSPHDGPDKIDNIVVVCPNHHAELDFFARTLRISDLRSVPGHSVDPKYLDYHNENVKKLQSAQ